MMNWLPKIFRGKLYNHLAEEMRQHLEEKTEQFVRDGMPREKAGQAARKHSESTIRAFVHGIDSNFPVLGLETMGEHLSAGSESAC